MSRRNRSSLRLSVRADGPRGGWAAEGGSSRSSEENMALSCKDTRPRCAGRLGESGIGLDYNLVNNKFTMSGRVPWTYGIAPSPLPRSVVIIAVFVIKVRPGFALLPCMNRR